MRRGSMALPFMSQDIGQPNNAYPFVTHSLVLAWVRFVCHPLNSLHLLMACGGTPALRLLCLPQMLVARPHSQATLTANSTGHPLANGRNTHSALSVCRHLLRMHRIKQRIPFVSTAITTGRCMHTFLWTGPQITPKQPGGWR